MPERAPMPGLPNETAVVHITVVSERAVLWLKSWLPEHVTGGKPVVLGGRELPSAVGATLSGPMHVLCVGPGEWLIVSQEPAARTRKMLGPDLPGQGLALVDLNDGVAILDVRGSAAREVMGKGCGLDFHPRSFPAGRCARTRFAQIAVTVECVDESLRYELYLARSHLAYLHSWLIDAAVDIDGSGA